MSNNISLAAARTRANVTQSDAARKMNVSVQTMWKWEKGIAPVARRHWARLASLLRVKEDELEEIPLSPPFFVPFYLKSRKK